MVKHLGGHLPFEGDITESVKPGEENCVLVKLNNQDNPVIPPGKSIKDLDFNYYSGLYQQVSLIAKDRLYIPDPVHAGRKAGGGVLVHYEGVRKAGATVHVQMEVRNDHNDSRET